MQKIILALCFALAVSNVQGHKEIHEDDFVNFNRFQHENQIKFYNAKMKEFNDLYEGCMLDVDSHRELISNSLESTNERLNSIQLLSDHHKQCVVKYRADIPTIVMVETEIGKCVSSARSPQSDMISGAVNARDELAKYLENYFEKQVKNCANATSPSKCLTTVVTNTNTFISENLKEFSVKLEAAVCTAKANIKRTLDCSFSVQENATTAITKANVYIDRCISKQTECKPCIYKCNDVWELDVSHVRGQIINNPFYGRTDNPQCLIMTVH